MEYYDEWDNPILLKNPRKRKKKEVTGMKLNSTMLLALAGLGYLGYCYFASRKAGTTFSLTPWKAAAVARQQIMQGARMRQLQLQQAQNDGTYREPIRDEIGTATMINPSRNPGKEEAVYMLLP